MRSPLQRISGKAQDGQTKPSTREDISRLEAATQMKMLDAAVASIVSEWQGVVPGLDPDVRAIVARIARIDERLRASNAAILREAELSDNEFRVLAALMRIGHPHRAAPTEIAGRYVPVTSGGLTGLARRLGERNLIRRVSHPRDQRSLLIELTPAGKKLISETMRRISERERTLMAHLQKEDLEHGNAFLQRLLHSIEAELP